jgi:hypothetical protein
VIDSLAKNGLPHAYYYLGDGKTQSAAGLVLSHLEQLCCHHFPSCLESFVDKNSAGQLSTQGRFTLEQKLGLDTLLTALTEISKVAEAIIVIDAWDERNFDSEDDFNRVLQHFQSLPWRIFITSRENPRIPISVPNLQHHFQAQDNSVDMQNFISHLMHQYVGCKPLEDTAFRSHAVDRLLNMSQGM